MQIKRLWLDGAAALAVVAAGYAAYHFAQLPGGMNGALACVFGFAALRIAYEMTVNRSHVPTIASAPAVRRQVGALLATDYSERNAVPYKIVDLGSGRGELARTLARALPQAQVTGVERSLLPHTRAYWVQKLLGPANLRCVRGDLFAYNCTDAKAVVLFLGKLTVPAGAKLWRELAPGSLVISNDFELEGQWPAAETVTLYTPFKTVLYIYRKTN